MKRAVISISYFDGDRVDAFKLARFIADLEPSYRPDVELCFVARHDAMPITPSEMTQFITTFPVSWMRTATEEVGHPKGSNAMAIDFFKESLHRVRDGSWGEVEAIIFIEPDCVPVAKDWINQLMREWMWAKTVCDVLALGCYRDKDVDVPHINGNAVWHPELARHIDFACDYTGKGWDSAIAPQLIGRKVHTSLIANLWKETNVAESRMARNPFTPEGTPPPVLIHGVKDDSAWNFARKQMKL
jgi:hypothetical protein